MLDNYFTTSQWLNLASKVNPHTQPLYSTVQYSFAQPSSSDEEMGSESLEMDVEAKDYAQAIAIAQALENSTQTQDFDIVQDSPHMLVEENTAPTFETQAHATQASNIDLQSFFESLNQARQYVLAQDDELANLITQQDLNQIYDFVLNTPEIAQGMNNMLANQSIYLSKEQSGLSRSLSFIRSRNNEYKLMLETKSKVADGTKHQTKPESGAEKKGKSAWRLDTYPPTPYFNLVVVLDCEDKLEKIQKEVACSQFFTSDYVNENELGPVHERNGKVKISIYSQRAVCDLSKIIDKGIPLDEKYLIMSDILRGVKQFHDAGFVIQDLKPANILVFSKQGKCRAKITDFGLVEAEYAGRALATRGYQSPEIAYAYSSQDPNNESLNYLYQYFQISKERTYANLSHNPCAGSDKNLWNLSNKANDIWALGILFYELLYDGKHPHSYNAQQTIKSNPFLRGLLQENRHDRVNIDGAINEFNKCYKPNLASKHRKHGIYPR